MRTELRDIIAKLDLMKKPIRENYKAEIVGLFGSYSRGEQGPDSDLDIIARFCEGANLFHLSGLSIFLREQLQIPVDVVSERAVREELRERIYREAVML